MDLRYKISNWRQAVRCQSNNSRDLRIRVTDFLDEDKLQGTRISVEHNEFGCLFCCIVGASGTIVSTLDGQVDFEFKTADILKELAKFGFLISYEPNEHLSGDQVMYLMTLASLNYDKIRLLSVWKVENAQKVFNNYIVAFNIHANEQWLDASYSPSESEFVKALTDGSAINVTAMTKNLNFKWDWLYNWVADINDIIADNEGCLQ